MTDRHLDWPGVLDARDLGGLPVAGGGRTRTGGLVRAGALDHLTAEGWSALHATACGRSSTCATTTS